MVNGLSQQENATSMPLGNEQQSEIAVYTTVYPGVEAFLKPWAESLAKQTAIDFDLWIALHGINQTQTECALGQPIEATWLTIAEDASPAQVRERAFRTMIPLYDAIVLVDCDDLLLPQRVQAAVSALETSDVYGCALRLADADGLDLGTTLSISGDRRAEEALPVVNVFGLSNTAYRTDILERCLPIPSGIVAVDWYLATLAWLNDASFCFDRTPHMTYRRHGNNVCAISAPFSGASILRATAQAIEHYEAVLDATSEMASEKRDKLVEREKVVRGFQKRMEEDTSVLAKYVAKINQQSSSPAMWWWCVARPELEELWRS